MKKRIRLYEARIGMFVHELEQHAPKMAGPGGGFFILSGEDLDRVLGSRAMSVLIDTEKSTRAIPSSRYSYAMRLMRERLLRTFSLEELQQAESTLSEVTPLVMNILGEARMNGIARLELATTAINQIMCAARDNAAALIAMSRLKNRDETTYLHSLAVSTLLICFGRHLGFKETAVRELALGGLLHDIGKTKIPIEILNKAGGLTPAETDLVRTHPRVGYEMLLEIKGVPCAVLDICLYHHERYDGKGYGTGLRGEEIPLTARIAAICDVYDAMTTVRSYKRAWSQKETVEMMQSWTGHFDVELLGVFFSQLATATRD